MKHFIFKSRTGLIKNESIDIAGLDRKLDFIQAEQRASRADIVDIKRMLNKLTIDKHLQHEVDEYFENHEDSSNDLD